MVSDPIRIELPAFSGTRDEADALFESLPSAARTEPSVTVVIAGRDVMTTTDSFVDQLVVRLQQQFGNGLRVSTVAAPERLRRQLREAFVRYQLDPNQLSVERGVHS